MSMLKKGYISLSEKESFQTWIEAKWYWLPRVCALDAAKHVAAMAHVRNVFTSQFRIVIENS
jgi:hypothetical protein